MSLLKLEHCYKRYPSFLLDDVSFEIEPGTIVGFIGRNGAGKTTTLKGIIGLLHFDKGEVYAFDKIFNNDELENRQYISFTLSDFIIYQDAKIKQVTDVTKRFYKEWDDNIYHKLLDKFGLDENKKLKELSSGMKVKYNLAVALSHNAKLLILDEPTSGLDPVSRDEILDIFKSLVKNGERSILFSTHITTDLEKCATHITYIHQGKIVATTSKENFINHFVIVEGDKEFLDKSMVLGSKVEDEKFIGLMRKSDLDALDKDNPIKANCSFRVPELDEIMIYLERGDDDEEFII